MAKCHRAGGNNACYNFHRTRWLLLQETSPGCSRNVDPFDEEIVYSWLAALERCRATWWMENQTTMARTRENRRGGRTESAFIDCFGMFVPTYNNNTSSNGPERINRLWIMMMTSRMTMKTVTMYYKRWGNLPLFVGNRHSSLWESTIDHPWKRDY